MNVDFGIGNKKILFAAVSGSLANGTATSESDVDIRGCYISPTDDLFALYYNPLKTTIRSEQDDQTDMEFHEVEKYIQLMLKGGFTTIEPVFQPKICFDVRYMATLTFIAKNCISKKTVSSYLGFCDNLIKEWDRRPEKHRLFGWRCIGQAYRILEGKPIEINTHELIREYGLSYNLDNIYTFKSEVNNLVEVRKESTLRDEPCTSTVVRANQLLRRIRHDDLEDM